MRAAALACMLALLAADGAGAQETCRASASAPALDHTILVVRDLDSAAAGFRRLGFRIKNGRLHANGLLNRHVKFRDGSGIELMTVRGRPGDAMARDYAMLLESGEGGVYAAMGVPALPAAERAAAALRLETLRSSSGPWRFVSFPPASPAAAIFFSTGGAAVRDADSVFAHAPAVDGIAEVWIEGGPALGELLSSLGATQCGRARGPDGRRGRRWALGRGTLVVVPARSGARPRVLGAVLRSRARGRSKVVYPHEAFWLQYR
jgi:hypothetical protein